MPQAPILVTGASGFLAAWIIPRLLAMGRSVVALDLTQNTTRLEQVQPADSANSARWACADITDFDACSAIVDAVRPSEIVHLAALQIPACRANPALGARVNLLGHIHMLDAARRVGARLVYTSSVAAKPRGSTNSPANLYGIYKRTTEEISRLYAQDFDVSSFGLRPHVVYGVGRDQGETSAITQAMRAAALGEEFVLPWSTRTCFQFAPDIAESFVRVLGAEWSGAAVSDMSATVESSDDVIAAIRACRPDARIGVAGPERVSPTDGFDTAPLRRVIGALPCTTLMDGVAETIEHFARLRAASVL